MEKKNKTKKWLIVLSVLILIAIAVALVIVLWPKDAKKLKEQTVSQSQNMFLTNENDKNLYFEMQNKIPVNKEDVKTETTQIYELAEQLNLIMNFYGDCIVFAQDNKTLQNNYSTIMRAYEDANKRQAGIMTQLNQVKSLGFNEGEELISGAWRAIRQEFVGYFDNYVKAIHSLNLICQNCIQQGVRMNKMTVLVSNTVDDYLAAINTQLITDDSPTLSGKLKDMSQFTHYLSNQATIKSYSFNTELQNQIKLVNDFETLYGQPIRVLVESIDETGAFDFTSEVVDLGGVREATEKFLKGEVPYEKNV